jgi:hypothetical protein
MDFGVARWAQENQIVNSVFTTIREKNCVVFFKKIGKIFAFVSMGINHRLAKAAPVAE